MKKLFSFSVLLFAALIIYSQEDFKAGKVILHNGDTLSGSIDYRGSEYNGGLCRFKDANNSIKEFYPLDIDSYIVLPDKYFVSKEIKLDHVQLTAFLEYLVDGKADIYFLRRKAKDYYFIEKEGMPIVELPYSSEVAYNEDGKYYQKEDRKHSMILKYYLQDSPELSKRVERFGAPTHKSLTKLAEDYHYSVCDDEECIVYQKNTSYFRVFLEPQILYSSYKAYSQNESGQLKEGYKGGLGFGIVSTIWMPELNEKFYFRAGVLYSNVEVDDAKYNIYHVPLELQYLYPRSNWRPKAFIGYNLNFYEDYSAHGLSFGAGINHVVEDKTGLSLTAAFRLPPFVDFDASDINMSFSLGYNFMLAK